ncbi:polyprenyl synthetase family protein [Buchnera aphidicola]|uniref:polyprenyl synthetase family protein n=1 Tax=Buchnera aphidicola TaxID=9 RepID=UPI003CE55CA9
MNFLNLYKTYQYRVNKKLYYILNNLSFKKSHLLKAMQYSLFSGSKRLRSSLVYATGDMLKVHITTLDVISVVIECIHSYSLIHDDLPCMDNDNLRRGKHSCHIKYGEDIALLAGDALQSLAFNILSNSHMPHVCDTQRIKMISELSKSIGSSGMCIGQMLDLESKKKIINVSQLTMINLYKTAYLIRSSIRLTYFSSNYISKSILSTLDILSISLGLAFQIQDDILDIKNDLMVKKNTYPAIVGLKNSQIKIKELYTESLSALDNLEKQSFDIKILAQLINFIIQCIK